MSLISALLREDVLALMFTPKGIARCAEGVYSFTKRRIA
jgi:hypothetical protein